MKTLLGDHSEEKENMQQRWHVRRSYLRNLQQSCALKNTEWEDRKKSGAEELAALDKARDFVYGSEFDYIGFKNERDAVSPRAVRQGFTKTLEQNVKDWRDKVTEAKIECLFGAELTLRKMQELEQILRGKRDDIDYKVTVH